jgi:parvulin-like peptidyl-prolyl isomerase
MDGILQRVFALLDGEDIGVITAFAAHIQALEDANDPVVATFSEDRNVIREFLRWGYPDQPDAEIDAATDDLMAVAKAQARRLMD